MGLGIKRSLNEEMRKYETVSHREKNILQERKLKDSLLLTLA